jgi:predicted dehydrogenase
MTGNGMGNGPASGDDGRTRIGIIGAGGIAQAHLDGYEQIADRARITAVADVDEEAAGRYAARAGGAAVLADYRELVASPLVDAVDICLPHHLHAPAILAAAEAGKHVLCEKPLCVSLAEADAIAAAVASSGITLMCAHNLLFLPTVGPARDLIREGRLGSLYTARTTNSFFSPADATNIGWRADRAMSGGGELLDTGYHPTYLLLHLLGGQPVEVTAMLSRHRLDFLEGEDSAQLLVRFADGVVGSIETSWAYEPAGSTEVFSVVGDRGSLWSDGRSLTFKERGQEPVMIMTADHDTPETITLEVIDFVACLRDGRRPLNTELEGIAVLKVILAAYASAEGGRIVALTDL